MLSRWINKFEKLAEMPRSSRNHIALRMMLPGCSFLMQRILLMEIDNLLYLSILKECGSVRTEWLAWHCINWIVCHTWSEWLACHYLNSEWLTRYDIYQIIWLTWLDWTVWVVITSHFMNSEDGCNGFLVFLNLYVNAFTSRQL